MKTLLLSLALILCAATTAQGQVAIDTAQTHVAVQPQQRLIFYASGKMVKSHPAACKDIISFRSTVVRFHPAGMDSTVTFPVVTIQGNTKKGRFNWACADRTFAVDILKGVVIVRYPFDKSETIYMGRVVLK